MLKKLLPILLVCCLFGCEQDQSESSVLPNVPIKKDIKLFEKLNSTQTGINFTNQLKEDESSNLGLYDYYYNGAGVAIADINNDGKEDIFFTGNTVSNKLYLNEGELKFKDISNTAKIESNKWSTGVTSVDINGDGFLDFYVSNSSPNKDHEAARNQFFINNGDLTFTEKAKEMGVDDNALSSHAAFFDFDKDNDLDLFVLNHTEYLGYFANDFHDKIDKVSKKEYALQSCNLFRNNGNGQFEKITLQAGLERPGFGLGVAIADLNEDGWPDIYVTNDFFIPDFMYINNKNGTFTDQIKTKLGHTSYYSMGCDAADFNNDGLIDIGVVDMTPSDHVRNKTLMASMDVSLFRYLNRNKEYIPQYMFNTIQLNNGFGIFSEVGLITNTSQSDWSWTALFADFDNDGWKDYLVSNGFRRDTKHNDWRTKVLAKQEAMGKAYDNKAYFELLMEAEENPVINKIYQNNGDYSFTDKSTDWGFTDPSFSNGGAYADLDGDGDLEIVINNIDQEAFVFKNKSEQLGNNFIRIKLSNSQVKTSPFNAKVYIKYEDKQQMIEYNPSRGYLSSMEHAIHFGLEKVKKVDVIEVVWGDNTISKILNPNINQTHLIDKSKISATKQTPPAISPRFADISRQQPNATTTNKENDFDDFEKEILLPHKQSNWGPCLCKGDVNNDGLLDYYVGGAAGSSGQLFIQASNGVFNPFKNQTWKSQSSREDGGCTFLDANQDGLLDLYVSSGGGIDVQGDKQHLQDRLYLNNGKDFNLAKNAIPQIKSNSGKVAHADIDGDGDEDLLIAGRGKAGQYPFPSNTVLLVNDKGVFKQIESEKAPELELCGMVTDFVFSDFNNDKKIDIILVGEWMNITFFENQGGSFSDVTEKYNLGESKSWWYSIKGADFDKDGDIDYIIGGLGENNKFHPSKKKPLHVFTDDFDDSGSLDIVLSKMYKEELVPLRGKECSSEQMPFISKKFPTYKEFSESSLTDIYTEEKLDKALHHTIYSLSSVYLENNNESFTIKKLPIQAQFFPILDMEIYDFDGDKNLDVICAGNIFETEPETPRYDSGKGLLLFGDGKGNFNCSSKIKDNGIFLFGQVNEMEMIPLGSKKIPTLIIGNNNAPIQFYALRK